MVKDLIEKGVNPNTIIDNEGWTPLLLAVEWNHLNIVEYLVEQAGADLFYEESEWESNALDIAKFEGNNEIAVYLERKMK